MTKVTAYPTTALHSFTHSHNHLHLPKGKEDFVGIPYTPTLPVTTAILQHPSLAACKHAHRFSNTAHHTALQATAFLCFYLFLVAVALNRLVCRSTCRSSSDAVPYICTRHSPIQTTSDAQAVVASNQTQLMLHSSGVQCGQTLRGEIRAGALSIWCLMHVQQHCSSIWHCKPCCYTATASSC